MYSLLFDDEFLFQGKRICEITNDIHSRVSNSKLVVLFVSEQFSVEFWVEFWVSVEFWVGGEISVEFWVGGEF